MNYRPDFKKRDQSGKAAQREMSTAGQLRDGRTLPSMVRPITERAKGPRDL